MRLMLARFDTQTCSTLIMHYLVSAIVEKLQLELSTAVAASQQAHDSATHSKNIAANKYDTLAVEAAYLAHGQSMRIASQSNPSPSTRIFNAPPLTRAPLFNWAHWSA
jgi:hypothetical protein